METASHEIVQKDAPLHWGAAVGAGLITGAIAWLLSHGTPWFASGIVSPTLMGRDLKPAGVVDPTGSVLIVLAQAIVSIGYGLVIAAVAARLRRLWAVAAGGLIGLVLYALNFGAFHFLRGIDWTGAEISVLVTHVVFGMVAAGLYRGLAARANQTPPDRDRDSGI